MDFSNRLFSKEGAPPDLLPCRLRLPSGETRYVNEIELEEIHLCGYTGPFDVPELKVCQQLEWCCKTSAFKIINKTDGESNEYLEHVNTLGAINIILSEEEKFLEDVSLFTEDYIRYTIKYFDLLKQLRKSGCVLKHTDIETAAEQAKFVLLKTPETDKKFAERYTVYKTKTEFNEAFKKWGEQYYDGFKSIYEFCGVISIGVPTFYNYYKPDPSWTVGSGVYGVILDEYTLDFRTKV